jgi:hypothetical protein
MGFERLLAEMSASGEPDVRARHGRLSEQIGWSLLRFIEHGVSSELCETYVETLAAVFEQMPPYIQFEVSSEVMRKLDDSLSRSVMEVVQLHLHVLPSSAI